ncbi:polarity establishment/cellular polarization [Colletotrichum tamarilloi]|nr:polarity establishment/cellular polarization [Colletotrichum tamarilloi]KAK1511946.1 polarity establishment/cellular polarization [Colletotrichum tamarilloi]
MPLLSYNASVMAMYVMLSVFLSLAALAGAVPVVYFPFNSQLPPATRISEPFSYTLSPQTFSSQSRLSYSLLNSPAWLSIDASTGRLSGIPEDKDVPAGEVVGIPVDIVATDDSGSATMTATLVVTRRPTPKLNIPLSEQIKNFGDTSSPSAVVASPASDFSFTFAKDTFSYAGDGLNYYATSADSSPLPSWIKFDAGSLTFAGKTPPFESLVQPPQKFDFSLVGSDIIGFSAVSVVFSIVVGAHRLTTDTPTIEINATRGTNVSYTALAGSIRLDGNSTTPSELNLTVSGLPSWLSVDNNTFEIQGNPPEDAKSSNSTLTFRDVYSDTLDIILSVSVVTRIFRNTNLSIEATPGKNFTFDVEPYLWTPSDIDLSIDSSADWVNVDGLVISGMPPKTTSPENITVNVKAASKSSEETETVTADLEVLPLPATTTTDSPTSSTKPTNPAPTSDPQQGLKAGYIALAILLPLLFLAIVVLLIICCRRRQKRESIHENFKNSISEPVPGSFVMNGGAHSRDGSSVGDLKKPEDNRRSRGYFNSAVQKMRQSRTLSTITGSRMSQSNTNNRSSYWRGSERSPTPRSPSVTSSWLTEGVLFHPQHTHQGSTSTYDGPSDVLSGSSGFLQGQRDDSFRSVLDVTIPSINAETSSIQATPDLAYTSPWGEPSRLTLDRSQLLPGASGSESLASIPEQPTPLGSNPTNGNRFSPSQRPRKAFPIMSDLGSQSSLRSSRSGSGRGRFVRQDSRPDSRHGSVSRPISRKSDSSPFFGGRSVVPSRNRYILDSDDSDSLESARGTENWRTIPPPRDSLGIAYEELTRSSPFMRHTPSLSPRPLSIIKKDSSGPVNRDSRVGKQTPLSRQSSSSSNIMAGRWNRDSLMQRRASGNRPDYASSRASSEVLGKGKGLARYSSGPESEGSGWVTEAGTVGNKGPRSRRDSSSEDFRVFM